jgi:hypothetical protein
LTQQHNQQLHNWGGVTTRKIPLWTMVVIFYDLIFGAQVSPLNDGFVAAKATQLPSK